MLLNLSVILSHFLGLLAFVCAAAKMILLEINTHAHTWAYSLCSEYLHTHILCTCVCICGDVRLYVYLDAMKMNKLSERLICSALNFSLECINSAAAQNKPNTHNRTRTDAHSQQNSGDSSGSAFRACKKENIFFLRSSLDARTNMRLCMRGRVRIFVRSAFLLLSLPLSDLIVECCCFM